MPSRFYFALTVALLLARSPSSSGSSCFCPQISTGWLLFQDSNRGIPDFFSIDKVSVQEIDVCEHGNQMLFMSEQNGNMFLTALVIVRPDREFLKTRLGGWDNLFRLDSLHEKYLGSFSVLIADLTSASGGTLAWGVRMDFLSLPQCDRPYIEPPKELILQWNGMAIPLRGYLDVYYTMIT